MIQASGQESSTPTSNDSFDDLSLEEMESSIKGENPHTFRVAQAIHDEDSVETPSVRVEKPVERTVDDLVELEPTFLAHEAVTKRPFTASYYNLDKVYDALSEGEKNAIRAIDNYIAKKVQSGKFVDSAESATQIIKELEKRVNLKENHSPFYKAERIAKYLTVTSDYYRHKERQERILGQGKKETENTKVQKAREAQIRSEAVAKVLMDQTKQMMEQREKTRLALLKLVKDF